MQQAVQLIRAGGRGGAAAGGASRTQPLDSEAEATNLAEVAAVHRYRQLADGGGAAPAAEAQHSQPAVEHIQQEALGPQPRLQASSQHQSQQQQRPPPPPPPPLEQLRLVPEQPLLLPLQSAVQQQLQGPPERGSAARGEPVVDPEVQVLRQRTWAADYIIGLDGRPQLATWPKVKAVPHSFLCGGETLLSSRSTS